MADRCLRLMALEIQQGPRRRLYSFAIDGKVLLDFTAIARVRRDGKARLNGYQRPEVLTHIAAIRRYLESPDPMIPNALVVAFDERVAFDPGPTRWSTAHVRLGTLVIPLTEATSEREKPAWLVDGQQRAAAIRDASLTEFPVSVLGFFASSEEQLRSQFILVNSAKPLPKSLITELLPSTLGELPEALQRRRVAATLLEGLNFDSDSPLVELIKTITTPDGVVKDTSLIRMIENSLSDGVLYRYRGSQSGEFNIKRMLRVLKEFWWAVRDVFPGDWGLQPRRSRLLHGAGVASLGYLMDTIGEGADARALTRRNFATELRRIAPLCHWSKGEWKLGPGRTRRWNDVQNTPKDIRLLADHLVSTYQRRAKRSQGPKR